MTVVLRDEQVIEDGKDPGLELKDVMLVLISLAMK